MHLPLADGSTYPHSGKIIFADRQVNEQTGTIQIVASSPIPKFCCAGTIRAVQTPTGSITGAATGAAARVSQQQGSHSNRRPAITGATPAGGVWSESLTLFGVSTSA